STGPSPSSAQHPQVREAAPGRYPVTIRLPIRICSRTHGDVEKPMLTRREFGLAGAGLVAAAAGLRAAKTEANEETMAATTTEKFEITKTPEEWRKILTPEQFHVLREQGTERAFTSPLDKTYTAGTYDCAGCDLPLFSSDTKFHSGTGWPSFF